MALIPAVRENVWLGTKRQRLGTLYRHVHGCKCCDHLRLPVFEDLEVVGGEAGDRLVVLVGDVDVYFDELDAGAERGRRSGL